MSTGSKTYGVTRTGCVATGDETEQLGVLRALLSGGIIADISPRLRDTRL